MLARLAADPGGRGLRGRMLPAALCRPLPGRRSRACAARSATVDVAQIDAASGTDEARLAVEIRNALLFDLTGGGEAAAPGLPLEHHG